mmetsp:Transcript_20514/g.62548  ORF Transcript_20514/g.62548 Transcript_20514/m.62548 type:complete len:879 (-) Transcript_20514:610-3246(-)
MASGCNMRLQILTLLALGAGCAAAVHPLGKLAEHLVQLAEPEPQRALQAEPAIGEWFTGFLLFAGTGDETCLEEYMPRDSCDSECEPYSPSGAIWRPSGDSGLGLCCCFADATEGSQYTDFCYTLDDTGVEAYIYDAEAIGHAVECECHDQALSNVPDPILGTWIDLSTVWWGATPNQVVGEELCAEAEEQDECVEYCVENVPGIAVASLFSTEGFCCCYYDIEETPAFDTCSNVASIEDLEGVSLYLFDTLGPNCECIDYDDEYGIPPIFEWIPGARLVEGALEGGENCIAGVTSTDDCESTCAQEQGAIGATFYPGAEMCCCVADDNDAVEIDDVCYTDEGCEEEDSCYFFLARPQFVPCDLVDPLEGDPLEDEEFPPIAEWFSGFLLHPGSATENCIEAEVALEECSDACTGASLPTPSAAIWFPTSTGLGECCCLADETEGNQITDFCYEAEDYGPSWSGAQVYLYTDIGAVECQCISEQENADFIPLLEWFDVAEEGFSVEILDGEWMCVPGPSQEDCFAACADFASDGGLLALIHAEQSDACCCVINDPTTDSYDTCYYDFEGGEVESLGFSMYAFSHDFGPRCDCIKGPDNDEPIPMPYAWEYGALLLGSGGPGTCHEDVMSQEDCHTACSSTEATFIGANYFPLHEECCCVYDADDCGVQVDDMCYNYEECDDTDPCYFFMNRPQWISCDDIDDLDTQCGEDVGCDPEESSTWPHSRTFYNDDSGTIAGTGLSSSSFYAEDGRIISWLMSQPLESDLIGPGDECETGTLVSKEDTDKDLYYLHDSTPCDWVEYIGNGYSELPICEDESRKDGLAPRHPHTIDMGMQNMQECCKDCAPPDSVMYATTRLLSDVARVIRVNPKPNPLAYIKT